MYGTAYGEGNLPISPQLREYIAMEPHKRNQIEKEWRKAQELRESPGKGGAKGAKKKD